MSCLNQINLRFSDEFSLKADVNELVGGAIHHQQVNKKELVIASPQTLCGKNYHPNELPLNILPDLAALQV